MKPIQTYPIFTTLAANLRPLSDLKSFVGDVLIDFQRDGLNVHGISMEGQLGFELKLFGNVVFPLGSGDGNFKVSIGIEPSIIASDIKHISSDMEISFTIYNFFSDITKTWVPALCITCDACHHNSKFRPLDVRTNNMTKSPTEYATHFISIRDLHGAITAAKSSRIKAIGLSLSSNHDKLIFRSHGNEKVMENGVPLYESRDLTTFASMQGVNIGDTLYAFMIFKGICDIAPIMKVDSIKIGFMNSLFFVVINYVRDIGYFHAVIAPIPNDALPESMLVHKRRALNAPPAPTPKRAFYDEPEEKEEE